MKEDKVASHHDTLTSMRCEKIDFIPLTEMLVRALSDSTSLFFYVEQENHVESSHTTITSQKGTTPHSSPTTPRFGRLF